MNYLFELSHPKHYYQFRIIIQNILEDKTNKILIIARDKDVLLNVLNDDGISFIIFGKHGKSIISKFLVLPRILFNYFKIIRNYKIDIVVSKASPYAAIISKALKIKTVITPDSEIVQLTKQLVAPYSTVIITPQSFSLDYGLKQKRIKGFFEDCYLHPSVFNPKLNIIEKLGFSSSKPFFILRFISWNANHDFNNYGFKQNEKLELVLKLKKYGDVYISSEGKLPLAIEKYRIRIPPSKIHHVLHFASIYIGDSQTMATESALLGTPAIRYNSFVGENDMTNFIVLEKKYKLLKNYNNFFNVLDCVDNFLSTPENKQNWLKKRKDYYLKVGDINKEILSIIEEC